MSIQQWSVARSELCPVGEEAVIVVDYDDHLAAVAEARREGRESIALLWDADKDTFPGRIIESFDRGVAEEKRRIRAEVVDYYKVAPKAGETILRIIDGGES